MTRVAMMGAGSWGTAFAMVLAHAGCEVTMWARDPKTVEQIMTIHQNRSYHPGIELPAEVRATLTPQEALQGADYVVLAMPSQVVRGDNNIQTDPNGFITRIGKETFSRYK